MSNKTWPKKVPCSHNFRELTLPKVKGTLHGLSCGVHKEEYGQYDVSVFLDAREAPKTLYRGVLSADEKKWTKHLTVEEEDRESTLTILYPIEDQNIPVDYTEFDRLVQTIKESLEDGNRVAVSCIGGHGRTGLVLACVVGEMLGLDDPVEWVRKNYCPKAVESDKQHEFIHFFCQLPAPILAPDALYDALNLETLFERLGQWNAYAEYLKAKNED